METSESRDADRAREEHERERAARRHRGTTRPTPPDGALRDGAGENFQAGRNSGRGSEETRRAGG